MNRYFDFCKNSLSIIKMLFHFTVSAWTFQVLIHAKQDHSVNRGARRFEKMVNTACFLLSPLITLTVLLFTAAAFTVMAAAGLAGCAVVMLGCVKKDEVNDKVCEQNQDSSHHFVTSVLSANSPAPLKIASVEKNEAAALLDAQAGIKSPSESEEITEDTTCDEDGPSLCSLGLM